VHCGTKSDNLFFIKIFIKSKEKIIIFAKIGIVGLLIKNIQVQGFCQVFYSAVDKAFLLFQQIP